MERSQAAVPLCVSAIRGPITQRWPDSLEGGRRAEKREGDPAYLVARLARVCRPPPPLLARALRKDLPPSHYVKSPTELSGGEARGAPIRGAAVELLRWCRARESGPARAATSHIHLLSRAPPPPSAGDADKHTAALCSADLSGRPGGAGVWAGRSLPRRKQRRALVSLRRGREKKSSRNGGQARDEGKPGPPPQDAGDVAESATAATTRTRGKLRCTAIVSSHWPATQRWPFARPSQTLEASWLVSRPGVRSRSCWCVARPPPPRHLLCVAHPPLPSPVERLPELHG